MPHFLIGWDNIYMCFRKLYSIFAWNFFFFTPLLTVLSCLEYIFLFFMFTQSISLSRKRNLQPFSFLWTLDCQLMTLLFHCFISFFILLMEKRGFVTTIGWSRGEYFEDRLIFKNILFSLELPSALGIYVKLEGNAQDRKRIYKKNIRTVFLVWRGRYFIGMKKNKKNNADFFIFSFIIRYFLFILFLRFINYFYEYLYRQENDVRKLGRCLYQNWCYK